MVAAPAVHRAAARITGETVFKRRRLDALVQLETGLERRAAGAVGDQLDRLKQPAPADIADVPMIAETLGQPLLQVSAQGTDPIEQLLLIDDPLHLKRGCAGERVRQI